MVKGKSFDRYSMDHPLFTIYYPLKRTTLARTAIPWALGPALFLKLFVCFHLLVAEHVRKLGFGVFVNFLHLGANTGCHGSYR